MPSATLRPASRPAGRSWSPRLRFQSWWQSRLPLHDTQTLTQANVYIVPSRAGVMYAATVLVLLLASINYQLNLGYVLTFLLAGSGVVSMHVTHGTLRGLVLHLRPPTSVHAGQPAVLDIVLTSPARQRYGIGLKVLDAPDATRVWTDVPAGGQSVVHVSWVPGHRGRHALPALSAETRFPLGLFRCWTVWRPAATLLAWPAIEPEAPALPAARPVPGHRSSARSSDGGEVEGVRAYRRGDPLKLVAWKKAAQAMETGAELVSRDTSASARRELWLEWDSAAGLDPEARLSRLAAWTLAAERAGIEFGLRLPGVQLDPAAGEVQRRQALDAMALWA